MPVTSPSPVEKSKSARDAEFAAIALPHLPYIARVARALTGVESDADDLVQETYLRAYRYWHTFQRGTDCKRWLSQICRNVMSDMRRRERQEEPVDDTALENLAAIRVHQAALAAGLGDMYARLDLGPAILDAIDRLDPIFRAVVVLSDVEELSYEEVAQQLDIPIGTVRSRLYRGRRTLQESLLEYARDAGFGVVTKKEK